MTRINFDLPEERVEELSVLAEKTGAKTRVQLFNQALTLLEWYVQEREEGRAVGSMNQDTERFSEILFPGMPAIKKVESVEDKELDNKLEDDAETLATTLFNLRLNSMLVKDSAQTKVEVSRAQNTLNTVFEPTIEDISVYDLENLLLALGGKVSRSRSNRLRIALNDARAVFHVPTEDNKVNPFLVKSLRKFLLAAGVEEAIAYLPELSQRPDSKA